MPRVTHSSKSGVIATRATSLVRFDGFTLGSAGTGKESLGQIRYQLLHRTAYALLEAKRFNASVAVMLVHSFSQEHAWFEDYQAFLGLFDVIGAPNTVTFSGVRNGVELYLSWVTGEEQYLLA